MLTLKGRGFSKSLKLGHLKSLICFSHLSFLSMEVRDVVKGPASLWKRFLFLPLLPSVILMSLASVR